MARRNRTRATHGHPVPGPTIPLPHNDEGLPAWTEAGQLDLPPDATPELILATIDVYLVQTDMLQQLYRHASETTVAPDDVIGYLGCINVNLDDLRDIMTGEDVSREEWYEECSIRCGQALEQFRELSGQYASLLQGEHPDPEEDLARMESKVQRTQNEARIRSNTESMRHCAYKLGNGATQPQKEAYRRVLFQLYHWNRNLAQDSTWTSDDPITAWARLALDDCEEIRGAQLARFTAETPLLMGPALTKTNDDIRRQAEDVAIEPVGFTYGVLTAGKPVTQDDTGETITMHCSYVAYHHDGKRHIAGIRDSYPTGYPMELAKRQMTEIATKLSHPDPKLQAPSRDSAVIQAHRAVVGAHCVTEDGMKALVDHARNLRITDTAIRQAVSLAVSDHPLVLLDILQGTGLPRLFTLEQAEAVIAAGQDAGMNRDQLAALCEAMDWQENELGLSARRTRGKSVRRMAKTARRAGFEPEAVSEIIDHLSGD